MFQIVHFAYSLFRILLKGVRLIGRLPRGLSITTCEPAGLLRMAAGLFTIARSIVFKSPSLRAAIAALCCKEILDMGEQKQTQKANTM